MKRTIQLISSLFCLALGVNPLYALNGTWGTSDGDWSDSTKWVGGIIADGATYQCVGPSLVVVTRTITVDSDRTIGSLNCTVNGFNRAYQFNGPGIITLDNGGGMSLVRGVNGPNIINCVLAGTPASVGFAYQAGRIVLNGSNTYSAPTFIYRGEVRIGNVEALPHGSRLGDITLVTGGNPGNTPTIDLDDFDITINGLNSDTNNTSAGTFPQITSASANAGTSTLTVGDNDSSGTYDGAINDGTSGRQLALTKIGTGTQALNGDSVYSGTTTVSAGTLLINGFFSGGGPFQVNGGVLGGVGSIYGAVTTGAGGAVGAGASAGTLTLYNGLDLSAGGTNIWELVANSESNPGTDYDQIVMYGGTLDLSDSTLIVSLGGSVNTADPFWNSSHTWTILSAPGLAGSTTNKYIQVVGGTPPGYFSTANDGNNVTLTFNYTGVVPQTPKPVKITSIVGAGTGSVTVNYTNTIAGTNYTLQYRTNLSTSPWLTAGSKTAAGTTDSQTDGGAGTSQRYYRVYYFFAP